jgi:hypothetical protein
MFSAINYDSCFVTNADTELSRLPCLESVERLMFNSPCPWVGILIMRSFVDTSWIPGSPQWTKTVFGSNRTCFDVDDHTEGLIHHIIGFVSVGISAFSSSGWFFCSRFYLSNQVRVHMHLPFVTMRGCFVVCVLARSTQEDPEVCTIASGVVNKNIGQSPGAEKLAIDVRRRSNIN